MKTRDIALIGLAVMGQNLALNMASKGYSVAVYNRTGKRTEEFIKGRAVGKDIKGTYSLTELVGSLSPPRKLMLMVKAGGPVDESIEKLVPLLSRGDLIIDGGNSFYRDTIRRQKRLKEKGILYIGTGVSGGEEGALVGPALMPGGTREAYALIEDIFSSISAKAEDGTPCVSHIGPDGAGHFVKMVHNGIEYGDMQLIGETVWTLREALGYDAARTAGIMDLWNQKGDVLSSYLIEITGKVMAQADRQSDKYLVDVTADITRMKGTGTWTVASALELLVPVPTIASAVFSREMSQDKDIRLFLCKKLEKSPSRYKGDPARLVGAAHDALYIAKISSYAQGFALLAAASDKYGWGLDLGRIASGWRAGCIIRAGFLSRITEEYRAQPKLANLMASPAFSNYISGNLLSLKAFIEAAHEAGVPTPAMGSSLDYILQISSPVMVSAQVAAQQRDYFGAHGYFKLKKDSPEIGLKPDGSYQEYHTRWMEEDRPEEKV